MQHHRGTQNNPTFGLEMLGFTTCTDSPDNLAGPFHRDTDSWAYEGGNRDSSHATTTLYAPVPGLPSLLFTSPLNYNYNAEYHYQHTLPAVPQEVSCLPFQAIEPAAPMAPQYCEVPNTAYVPTQTFPTPSELLVELGGNNSAAEPSTQSDYNGDLSRRPRRRPMNRGVGLIPGDSEAISSHEKKRHYLECLEQYVMYLHQQLNLVGVEPVPLERVLQYNGLNNRSIRTLLVHMENATRKLNTRTLREEQRFVNLRDAVYRQDQAFQHHKMTNLDSPNM